MNIRGEFKSGQSGDWDTLAKQIIEHCNSSIKWIKTDQALAESGLTVASSGASAVQVINNTKNKIATALGERNAAGTEKAFKAVETAMKHEDPAVQAVFEGVHTAMCRTTNRPNPIITQLAKLEETVNQLESDLKFSLKNAQPGAFTSKESSAITAVVTSAKATIAKHQENPFANSSTLAQAKQELKGELKKFETSLALKSFFARASEIVDSIKKSIVEAVKKIGTTGVPPMAKAAMEGKVAKNTTIHHLQIDVKNAKEVISPKGPKS